MPSIHHDDIQKMTEVQLIESPKQSETKIKNNDKQIVRKTLIPEKLKIQSPDDSLARFLSAEKQRVKEETQTNNVGMTANRSLNQDIKEKNSKPILNEKKYSDYKPVPIFSDDILIKETNTLKKNNPSVTVMDRGVSTTGEQLPQDVKFGYFTALNTNQSTFYSFYARVEELIRFRWETQVQGALNKMDRSFLFNVVGRKTWKTTIDFWLNTNGDFHSAHVLKESGLKAFDDAAVFAFRDARHFPNPNKEMIEDDGFIHLKYTFVVEYNPSPMVQQ